VKRSEGCSGVARPARLVVLRPIGYPLRDFHKGTPVGVTDEKLFEIYAKEQWMGNLVVRGDYLFDQRIIPDFAFQVLKVLPSGEVTISEETKIRLSKGTFDPSWKGATEVHFEDIVGHERTKRKCRVVMEYLRDPKRFGPWAPKNVLFYGPPGTGKTMAAKALSHETASSLFLVRATELIGEYVGDGSKRIHELYRQALESVPSIVFIDEFDAIGLDRSHQSVRGDVSEVVNALLTELEGIRENRGVVTIAATNNPPMLDPAIRSRFEEEIEFKLPDPKERLEILQKYADQLPIPIRADLGEYVGRTEGFSGRDLKEKLLKAALHKAILDDASEIGPEHLEAALKAIPPKSRPPKEMFH
jgi:AAA family ATPase